MTEQGYLPSAESDAERAARLAEENELLKKHVDRLRVNMRLLSAEDPLDSRTFCPACRLEPHTCGTHKNRWVPAPVATPVRRPQTPTEGFVHLAKLFHEKLEEKCQHTRRNTSVMVWDEYGQRQTPSWVLAERSFMFDLVNEHRAKAGRKALTLSDIVKAERLAYGHVDYTSKFALYCVELVSLP